MAETVERLLKRYKAAVGRRERFRSQYSDADDYTMPERNLWNKAEEGQKRNTKIYDSTGVTARTSFANRIQSDMFPPFQRWMALKTGPLVPEGQKQAMEQALEGATTACHAIVAASNFDTVINECLSELANGTFIMLREEGGEEEPLILTCIPCAHAAIEEGKRGTISAVFREYELEGRNIEATWPDAKLSDAVARQVRDNPEAKIKLIESSYEEGGKWAYCLICETDKSEMLKRIYDDNPFLVVRWSKVPGEVWGRGPVLNALPDIRTLNKLVELTLRYASLRVAGIWMVPNDGVMNPNNVIIAPGARIPIAPNSAGLQNVAPEGDMQLANLEREKLTMSIQRQMYDTRLPPDVGPVRSATEIMERVKELVRDIGAPFGRLMVEFVVPFIQGILNVAYKRGLILERVRVDGMMVRAQVVSPLAMVQNVSDVENAVRWMQILSAFGQETLAVSAKLEDFGDWAGEKMGVPLALRRSAEERKAMQQMAGQALAQQQGNVAASQIASGNVIPVA